MTGPGYVFKNSGTTPPAIDEAAANNYDAQPAQLGSQSTGEPLFHPSQGPSRKDKDEGSIAETTKVQSKQLKARSHELAYEATTVTSTGAVQEHPAGANFSGSRDIGWHKPVAEIPDPLVFDIPNGKLWSMIRRFNKDVYHVRSVPSEAARGLDLNEVPDEGSASDNMDLHLGRAYLVFVLNLASLLKHVSRLRSWKEPRRTAAFCMTYFVAWYLNQLTPLFLGTLMTIIASQSARNLLFPSAPRALVSIKTGGIETPAAGQLATTGTLTGAPEKQEGEAVEEEATNFVANFRHLIMRAMGAHNSEDGEGDPLEGKVPKPVRTFVKKMKAEGSAPGHTTLGDKQTQAPMEDVIWAKAKPENLTPILQAAPHLVVDIVDNLERLANALSPTPPFSRFSYIRVVALILPLFLVSFFVDYYMVYRVAGGGTGFVIFGDPIITPTLQWLNRLYPGWIGALNPKNNILQGVPTDKQLTITFLRIGEIHDTPIPPVPSSKPEDADQPGNVDIDEVPLGESHTEVAAAIQSAPTKGSVTANEPEGDSKGEPQHRHIAKFIRLLKGTTLAALNAKLGVDHIRAKAGSETTRDRVGGYIMPHDLIYAEPDAFKARFEGKSGWVYLIKAATPHLLFSTQSPSPNGLPNQMDPIFEISVDDIYELRRATASVSKPVEKMVEWSSDKVLLACLEFDDWSGKTWRLTALPERDELFNRLVAIGGQHWENM